MWYVLKNNKGLYRKTNKSTMRTETTRNIYEADVMSKDSAEFRLKYEKDYRAVPVILIDSEENK